MWYNAGMEVSDWMNLSVAVGTIFLALMAAWAIQQTSSLVKRSKGRDYVIEEASKIKAKEIG